MAVIVKLSMSPPPLAALCHHIHERSIIGQHRVALLNAAVLSTQTNQYSHSWRSFKSIKVLQRVAQTVGSNWETCRLSFHSDWFGGELKLYDTFTPRWEFNSFTLTDWYDTDTSTAVTHRMIQLQDEPWWSHEQNMNSDSVRELSLNRMRHYS